MFGVFFPVLGHSFPFLSAEYKYVVSSPEIVLIVLYPFLRIITLRSPVFNAPLPAFLSLATAMTVVSHSLDIPVLLSLANMSILSSVCLAASSFVVYLASLAFYRLYLHPLAQYPGPFLARITDWLVFQFSLSLHPSAD